MEHVDALLINPYWSLLSEGVEHLGFGYMAAVSRLRGLSIAVMDAPVMGWNNELTIENAKKFSPLVIGVSIPFQEGASDAFELVKLLRDNFSCHICLGGIYPTFEYESILNEYNEIDSIVLGEGEETFPELVSAVKEGSPLEQVHGLALKLEGKVCKTQKRPLIEDLDELPFPERDTLPAVLRNFGFASIVSSRGCYGRCSFCSVDGFYSNFGSKFRVRSAVNVVDEMEMLMNKYDVHNFMFNDANFIGGISRGRERAYDIAQEIVKRGMKIEYRIQCRANDVDKELFACLRDSGLTRVYIGIESGSQPQLDRYVKDITVRENYKALSVLKELGLFVKIGFIMFDRDATFDDLLNNINFIKGIKKMFGKDQLGYIYPISKLMPLSGSAFKNQMEEQGALKGSYKDYSYDFKDKKVQFFYSLMKKSSGTIWGLKSRLKSGDDPDTKDWTRGWKQWDNNKSS
jgi:radical SAM superfamily enzyme YgiQ (UPF0313 family)